MNSCLRLPRLAQFPAGSGRSGCWWRDYRSVRFSRAPSSRRDRSAEVVVEEVQVVQIGEAVQFARDRARQVVIGEPQATFNLARLPSSGGIGPVNWLPER